MRHDLARPSGSHAESKLRARPTVASHARFLTAAAMGIGALLTFSSLGGIMLPSTYAAETPTWAVQGLAQDWMNLVLAVPLLGVAGAGVMAGSRKAVLLLGGVLVYNVYNFLLYAFAIHFNAFFLVYCAVLGLSAYALATMGGAAMREDTRAWFVPKARVRFPAGVLILSALLFGALWLGEVFRALASGGRPASMSGEELFTNPVHVIDLALLLPAFLVAGVSLLRRRPLGFFLAPVLLVFSTLMAISLAGMMALMHLRGFEASLAVATGMLLLALLSGLGGGRLLGALREE